MLYSDKELRKLFNTTPLKLANVQDLASKGFRFSSLEPREVLKALDRNPSLKALAFMLEENLGVKDLFDWTGRLIEHDKKHPFHQWYPPYKNLEEQKMGYRFLKLLSQYQFNVDFFNGRGRMFNLLKNAKEQIHEPFWTGEKFFKTPIEQVLQFGIDFDLLNENKTYHQDERHFLIDIMEKRLYDLANVIDSFMPEIWYQNDQRHLSKKLYFENKKIWESVREVINYPPYTEKLVFAASGFDLQGIFLKGEAMALQEKLQSSLEHNNSSENTLKTLKPRI